MLSDSQANARFWFTGYLQYTMYAKLLLKAIPYALHPQFLLPAPKRNALSWRQHASIYRL
ncbi:hypothetical protein DJ548_07395 [Klebsiella grimontii]|nr:hypothetical protein CRI71_02970 [Klebsiella sp. KG9]TYG09435.1 hypothetical protein DJ548_07395 [Klebsiella grimontii]